MNHHIHPRSTSTDIAQHIREDSTRYEPCTDRLGYSSGPRRHRAKTQTSANLVALTIWAAGFAIAAVIAWVLA